MKSVIFLILILTLSSDLRADDSSLFDFGVGLSEYKQYKIFPFLERGLRAQKRGDLDEAELNFRKVNELVNDHFPTTSLLVAVLKKKGEFPEAIRLLTPFSATIQEARAELADLYAQSIDLTNARDLSRALRACRPDYCGQFVSSVAYREFKRSGAGSAREFLNNLSASELVVDKVHIYALRSSYDEIVHDWEAVIFSLGVVERSRTLEAGESLRQGFAFLKLGMIDRALAVQDRLDGEAEIESKALRRALIQRALADKADDVALAQYRLLLQQTELEAWEKRQLATLLSAFGSVGQAETLLVESGESDCVVLMDFYLQTQQSDKAKQNLLDCPYSGKEDRWLELAINLNSERALRSRAFSGNLEQQRVEALVNILASRSRYPEVVQLLEANYYTLSINLRERLAVALEQVGRDAEAADIYVELAGSQLGREASRKLRYLDKASYLYMQAGNYNLARVTLTRNFPFGRDTNAELLNQRLISLLHLVPEVSRKPILLDLYKQPFGETYAIPFAELWRSVGNCRELAEASGESPERRDLVALGHCYSESQPGLAAYYFERAKELGAESLDVSLAYTYYRAGDYARSFSSWKSVPKEDMTPGLLKSAALVALSAGEIAQAEHWWTRADLQADEEWWYLGAQIAEANDQPQLSVTRISEAIETSTQQKPAYFYWRAVMLRRLGRVAEAALDEATLSAMQGLTPEQNAHLAYVTADPSASDSSARLSTALSAVPDASEWREQLMYLSEAEGKSEEAAVHLRTLIDGLEPDLPPMQESALTAHEKEYRLQRMHEYLTRRHQLSFGAWQGEDSPGSVNYGSDPDPFSSEGGYLSYEYRLGDAPVVKGREFAAYAHGSIALSGDEINTWDTVSPKGTNFGIGLRLKPIGSRDLNLFFEVNRREVVRKTVYDVEAIHERIGDVFEELVRLSGSSPSDDNLEAALAQLERLPQLYFSDQVETRAVQSGTSSECDFVECLLTNPDTLANYRKDVEAQTVPDVSIGHESRSELDIMVGLSTSLLNGLIENQDWLLNSNAWIDQDFYVGWSHWLESHDYQFSARYSVGPQIKIPLPFSSSIQPYGFAQTDRVKDHLVRGRAGLNGLVPESGETVATSRVGLGAALHFRSGSGKYDTFRQNYSLKIEYQKFVDDKDLPSDVSEEGVFIKLEASL